eukprot:1091076-Prymnesium_polylepis.1
MGCRARHREALPEQPRPSQRRRRRCPTTRRAPTLPAARTNSDRSRSRGHRTPLRAAPAAGARTRPSDRTSRGPAAAAEAATAPCRVGSRRDACLGSSCRANPNHCTSTFGFCFWLAGSGAPSAAGRGASIVGASTAGACTAGAVLVSAATEFWLRGTLCKQARLALIERLSLHGRSWVARASLGASPRPLASRLLPTRLLAALWAKAH